jgi:outer membrane protein OmpA-like peptidoglycan-associated protein
MDLYVSRMQDDGTWSPAVNLGYPINTSADENSLQVFPDGRTALFATDRDEPGNLDLWKFSLPEFAVAEKVNLWRGEVVQALDGAPVQATVVVIDINGKQIGQQLSDATDGQFTLSYPSEETVTLQVKHPDYAFYSRTLNSNSHPDGVVRIELKKLEVGTVFVLQDVRFARSSFELDDAFQPELSQLASTLLDTDIRIRIIGHTDNEGSLERNQQLSEQRAQSVADYLVGLGIDPNRIETEGRGETVPIADNSTEQGRALNRRTEVIVID